MAFDRPFDLLVQCGACGIENLFSDFTASTPAVCNQCRERLLDTVICQSHQELACEKCGMLLLLRKDAPILSGESVCRCGGTQFLRQETPTLPKWIEQQSSAKVEDTPNDDFDWCRPAGGNEQLDNYNEIFDNDPTN